MKDDYHPLSHKESERLTAVITQIEQSRRFEQLPGVTICQRVLAQLGHPESSLRIIHIAGTNGKGSVSAFLHEILTAAGYKTGLFTSPHLIRFRERIRIGRNEIPKHTLLRLAEFMVSQDFGVSLTMFDYCLAIALLYFKEQQCDYVLLETGLGGRMDSTNAIPQPVLSIITRIGMDHMSILGNTVEKIAAEKAGILKKGIPAVFAIQQPEALHVLETHACENHVPWKCVDPQQLHLSEFDKKQPGITFSYKNHPCQLGIYGAYQAENAAAALEAVWMLNKTGADVKENAIQTGLQNARWRGRMELLSEEPFLLADGAHNADGAKALADSLRYQYPNEKFLFITAILAEKDYQAILEHIMPLAAQFFTVTPDSSRALDADTLTVFLKSRGFSVMESTCEGALTFWKSNKLPYKTVIFGSLYFIGEVLASMETTFL